MMEQKRFIFSINTRDGVNVPHLRVLAFDYEAAEPKIKSMYRYCEIVRSKQESVNQKESYNYEDVVDQISKT